MHIAVVWNPSKTERERLEAPLTAAAPDARLTWWETTEEDPGQRITQEAAAEGPDLILAAGGDGTVRAVAEALAELDAAPELGILPLGTGNLLARNLDVPLRLEEAAEHALTSTGRTIDFGWVEARTDAGDERHGFVVMVGFGIDANMIAETSEDLKAKAGWLAYVESLGRALSASESVKASVTMDTKAEDIDAHTIIVGNCGTVQGGLTLLPDARPDDGMLDVLMLSAENVGGWLETMKTMAWDNGLKRLLPGGGDEEATSGDNARYAQASDILIELPDARPFQIDGEQIGNVRRVEISIQRGALRLR